MKYCLRKRNKKDIIPLELPNKRKKKKKEEKKILLYENKNKIYGQNIKMFKKKK